MHYVEAFDRNQMMMTTWDSMVAPQSTARLIDAFVNSLNLADYGVKEMASEAGRRMIRRACSNAKSMGAIMGSSHHAGWQKAGG